jgi:1-deoxy-D-xylulose-5-phosphate reductoisomerase
MLDLAAIGELSFERPDARRFPCLGLAYGALREGGTAPAILNAANEIAVAAFLDGKLRYTGIPSVIEHALACTAVVQADSLETVLEADRCARRAAAGCVDELMGRAA